MANWVAVASSDHVAAGKQLGIMQICHGKSAPLRRLKPGDNVVYYSPTLTFKGKDKLQQFTAIGKIKEGCAYQVDMGNSFCPFRLDVCWYKSKDVPILPLINQLDFTRGKQNWGYQFRFGLIKINDHDMSLISDAMLRNFFSISP